MSFPQPTPAHRRRLFWRQLVERKTLVRHPVSLTRERIGVILLTALLTGFAWYAYTTRDAAIRQRVMEFLIDATAGEVTVDRASFEMFGGITLQNVRVAVPFDKRLDPTAQHASLREVFSAQSVRLVHDPWRLLLGDLRVEQIVATGPTIILAHNVETGLRNWQLLSTGRKAPRGAGRGSLRPRITIRSAKAVVVSINETGATEARIEELDADVRPHPQADTAYCIEVRRYSDPPERTTVIFDPGQRLVTNTPFVNARTIRLQLPKPAQRFFDRINLQGEVKLSRLVYDVNPQQQRSTTIELRSVRCAVPLSMLRGSVLPADGTTSAPAHGEGEKAVVTMTDAQGRLALRGNKLELDVSGLVNGAKCRVSGALDHVGGPLQDMGLDLEIEGLGVPAPEDELRRQLLSDPDAPLLLRAILADYEPRGKFDLDFRLVRPRDPGVEPRFSGTLRPVSATGRSRLFPYLVTDLSGQIRFEGNQVMIEDLRGRHGPAAIEVNGVVDRSTWWTGVEVNITGRDVPLDGELNQPLSERYRLLWNRFNPEGSADVSVRLRRPGVNQGEPDPRWANVITADLTDARILSKEYPYPLEGVEGRLDIEPDRVQFTNLNGHHGDASVHLDGEIVFGAAGEPAVSLRMEASRLRLDETLAAALPPDGRAAFAQFQPDGFADLSGTISQSGPGADVVYDLQADVYAATLLYQDFPYRLTDVSGRMAIRPDAITLLSVSGRHGEAELGVSGEVRREAAGFAADLLFDWRRLLLDQELHDALPGPLRDVWRLLEPSGTVNVRTAFHYSSPDHGRRPRHRTEIEPADVALCFKAFPLPLKLHGGRALITDEQVEFISLVGQTAEGSFVVDGQMDFVAPGARGVLTVNAKDMTFTRELVGAMAPRLRQALESINPRGRFDLRLDSLRFETAGEESADWHFAGRLTLRDAATEGGLSLRDAAGRLTGEGSVDADGAVALDAEVQLGKTVLAGWPLEQLVARLSASPDSPVLHVADASARLYGGDIAGMAEIRFGGQRTEYDMAVTARELQLQRYIEGSRSPSQAAGPSSEAAEGLIFGNLAVKGRTGPGGYREGAGEVFLREAQVWKLPIVFAIFQVLNLAPDENVFHDGWVKYYLADDTLTFHRIDLQGKAMSFIGGGRMDMRSKKLDVKLLAGSPVRVQVPLLTDLLQGAAREVMEVQVNGTLQHPQITPKPLRGLAAVLKTLFPEPPPAHSPNRGR